MYFCMDYELKPWLMSILGYALFRLKKNENNSW